MSVFVTKFSTNFSDIAELSHQYGKNAYKVVESIKKAYLPKIKEHTTYYLVRDEYQKDNIEILGGCILSKENRILLFHIFHPYKGEGFEEELLNKVIADLKANSQGSFALNGFTADADTKKLLLAGGFEATGVYDFSEAAEKYEEEFVYVNRTTK